MVHKKGKSAQIAKGRPARLPERSFFPLFSLKEGSGGVVVLLGYSSFHVSGVIMGAFKAG